MTAAPRVVATAEIAAATFASIRRAMVLDHCKWDPQLGDVETLARFALKLDHATWAALAADTERLAAEVVAMETELAHRPELWDALGVTPPLKRMLCSAAATTPTLARVMRFDFHPTASGFRLSEVNSDVPGGYAEASAFPALVAPHVGGVVAGDPGGALARAIAARLTPGARVALLSAPGYLEDAQVVRYVGQRLAEHGIDGVHVHPDASRSPMAAFDGVYRFYQAEWLAALPNVEGVARLVGVGGVPVANPVCAALTESKRLPVVWERLTTTLDAFPRYLPETRDPRDASWLRDADAWIVKPAYGNNGDDVVVPAALSRGARLRLAARIALAPRAWVVQRRFDVTPVATPIGDVHACIGVYTVDGRVAGIYGRATRGDVVDYRAIDVAVLLEETKR